MSEKEKILAELKRLEKKNNCGTAEFIEAKRIAYEEVRKAVNSLHGKTRAELFDEYLKASPKERRKFNMDFLGGPVERLMRSTAKLHDDIDDCVSQIVKSRLDKDIEAEGRAMFRMESLMVGTQQQLSCILDLFEEEPKKKTNALFEKCVAAVDPEIKQKVSDAVDKSNWESDLKKEIDRFWEKDFDENCANYFEAMKRYTSYMRNYFTIRDRMYNGEEKGHTIPNRIVDDNLPIHLENVKIAKNIPEEVFDKFREDKYLSGILTSKTPAQDITEVFTISFAALLNSQSAIDTYNQVIGGASINSEIRHQGLNEYIQLYRQQHPDVKVPLFKKLKKQILTEKESLNWLPDVIGDDKELVDVTKTLYGQIQSELDLSNLLFVDEIDKDKVYVNAKRLNNYSHDTYGKWKIVEIAIMKQIAEDNPNKPGKKEKGYSEKVKKLFKDIKMFKVSYIEDAVAKFCPDEKGSLVKYVKENICKPIGEGTIAFQDFEKALGENPESVKKHKNLIKKFFDSFNKAKGAASVFSVKDASLDLDPYLYEDIVEPFNRLKEDFVGAHNSVRNYLTRKPYSTNKVPVFFGSPSLLGGWDISKLDENRGLLFKEGNTYYLGILSGKAKKLLNGNEWADASSPLQVQLIKDATGAHMMLPGVMFGKKKEPRSVEPYNAPDDVLELYAKTKRKEVEVKNYTPEQVALMVDFYKEAIMKNPKWAVFDFKFKDTKEYSRLDDFYDDFDRQAYRVSFTGISKEFVEDAVEYGDLYLFQITCQDMLEKHHGKDGKYKVLLEEALSGKPDSKVRIQGGAAIYFRKASIVPAKITHPAGIPIKTKNPDNPRKEVVYNYDIIKDRRYTIDQFSFHLPVTVFPYADENGSGKVNRAIRELIRENPYMYVLGINRGERSLISISVTAPDGTIVEQRNFNVFDNFDYRRKLAERKKERIENKQNWDAVNDIKNLKMGYLSRVKGEIAKLVRKYNCVIAMERLDPEFKNSRSSFETNVYEQFERELIKMFGLLMDKDSSDRVNEAVQLADPCETETKRTKHPQNGIVFFINPSWISRTDPVTGFADMFLPFYESKEKAVELMSKTEGFRYNPKSGRFVLSFRYGKVLPERETGDPNRVWEVETYGSRIENVLDFEENPKGMWKDIVYNLTPDMRKLLEDNGVKYLDGKDIVPRLADRTAEFWKEFFHLLRLTMKLNNWDSANREFRMVGCTARNGRFFDSHTATENLPGDADINAARNIARKAHIVLRRIREYDPESGAKAPSLIVKDQEWFDRVQG